ncbi:MAG: hypothetical protein WCS65_13185 [Verrucomicrobiae bacterium]|jgi:hypothetical protein
MRTTIEIPDDLFREAKSRAALDGIALKDMVAESLRRLLGGAGRPAARRTPRRTQFPLIPPGPARPAMTRNSVKAEIEKMDQEGDLRHAGTSRH